MIEMEGVVKLIPVPKLDPPLGAAYQLMVPALAVAPNVNVPSPQRSAGVVEVTVGTSFIVAMTAVLEDDVHEPLVAST